jgi:hypothetical protein
MRTPCASPSSLRINDFDEYQNDDRKLSYSRRDKERPMRFYFDISDRFPIRDDVGRDFKLVSEAVVYAKYLATDLRCLEPDIRPQLSIQVIGEGFEQIHEEAVFT